MLNVFVFGWFLPGNDPELPSFNTFKHISAFEHINPQNNSFSFSAYLEFYKGEPTLMVHLHTVGWQHLSQVWTDFIKNFISNHFGYGFERLILIANNN